MVLQSTVESPDPAAAAPATVARGSRLEWLDSIRGLAALVVLIGHIAGAFAWPNWARHFFVLFDGRVAVTMFFVLSGFVLARPYIGEAADPPKRFLWVNFLTRRVTRIWLPWVAMFWISWLAREFLPRDFLTAPAMTGWAREFWTGPLNAMAILKQHFYSLHDPATLLMPQDWSLRMELQGSALIPIFVWLFRRNAWLALALGVLIAIVRPTGYYMLTFAAGVLLAGYRNQIYRFFASKALPIQFGLLVVAFILIETRAIAGPPKHTDRFVWNFGTLGCSLFLALALGSGQLQWLLSRKPLVFLGRISYSLYLIQFVVILSVLPPLMHSLNALGLVEPNVTLAIVMFAGIATTVAISSVLHRYIEQPCIDFGHWLGKFLRF
jgi:peptidoglycan/LPS O-acetylase OafA/YrhL